MFLPLYCSTYLGTIFPCIPTVRGHIRLFVWCSKFYGSPLNFSLNEIAGFETSSRPYLPKYDAPFPPRCHRSVVLCNRGNTWKIFSSYVVASFLVSSSHATFVKRKSLVLRGGLSSNQSGSSNEEPQKNMQQPPPYHALCAVRRGFVMTVP